MMKSPSKDVQEINRFIEETPNALDILPSWLEYKFQHLGPAAKREIFLAYFPPDDSGHTRRVYMDELTKIYHEFVPGNGCDWARNGSGLGSKFIVKRYDKNDKLIESGNAVFSIELSGFNRLSFKQTIPLEVRRYYKGHACAFCSSHHQVQIDHKIGLKLRSAKRIDEYQPLCRKCNDLKREWCKVCKRTGVRPDPRTIVPFFRNCPVGWIRGNSVLDRSKENPCDGCFCHDFIAFGDIAWRM